MVRTFLKFMEISIKKASFIHIPSTPLKKSIKLCVRTYPSTDVLIFLFLFVQQSLSSLIMFLLIFLVGFSICSSMDVRSSKSLKYWLDICPPLSHHMWVQRSYTPQSVGKVFYSWIMLKCWVNIIWAWKIVAINLIYSVHNLFCLHCDLIQILCWERLEWDPNSKIK